MADPPAPTKASHAPHPGDLLKSGKYSDLTLQCGDRLWKVHKSVVCIQSEFFAKACDGGFKEAHTGHIDLTEDDEHALAALIRFMYYGDYDVTRILTEDEQQAHAMLLHIRVVGLAQKYWIEPLERYGSDKVQQTMRDWSGDPRAHADAIYEIFTGTVDEGTGTLLRSVAIDLAVVKATELFADADEAIRKIFEAIPGFTRRWFMAIARNNSDLKNANASSEARSTELAAQVADKQESINKAAENVRKLSTQVTDLGKSLNDMAPKEQQFVRKPLKPDGPFKARMNQPIPQCYQCPNCDVVFMASIPVEYQHHCYTRPWVGRLKRGGVLLTRFEWERYLVKDV